MFINCTSREEGIAILKKQAAIIKNLIEVRNDFKRVYGSSFWLYSTELISVETDLNEIKEKLEYIDKLISNVKPPDCENKIFSDISRRVGDIRRRLVTCKFVADCVVRIVDDIKGKADNIERNVNNKTTENAIKQITDEISCKLKIIEAKAERISSDSRVFKELQDKLDDIFSDKSFKIKDFIQIKDNSFDVTWWMTFIFIIIISALTIFLPLWILDANTEVINACKNGTTTVSLGIILILAALAGIWSLAFTIIKSRIKIHEQDSRCFREFFQDM
jgi:hypothetical protein